MSPPAHRLTDAQRDERLAFLVDAMDMVHERLATVERQQAEWSLHMARFERHLDEEEKRFETLEANSALLLTEVKLLSGSVGSVKDMLDAWTAIKGAGRFAGWIGSAAKTVTAIATAAAVVGGALYYLLHGHKAP